MLARNMLRDAALIAALEGCGVDVLVPWECETKVSCRCAIGCTSFLSARILQSGAHALGVTERCAVASSSPAVRCHCRRSHLGGTASSMGPDMIFGKERYNGNLAGDCSASATGVELMSGGQGALGSRSLTVTAELNT